MLDKVDYINTWVDAVTLQSTSLGQATVQVRSWSNASGTRIQARLHLAMNNQDLDGPVKQAVSALQTQDKSLSATLQVLVAG